ncbi:hypothetical protein CCR94_13170 [Rhodoblastus sphagnicola]|uniref:DUF2336 domain-containing protein n=1 Tax=Rhodoblastus sphagnicola TaxID=333368 RepID=A0A2S6N6P7_9HYPH|nr:DUF2336 domain-containing protein [Rhodoblastus sphagnicola]MBB4197625.1 uncharacterized protein (DUF2336 family) [Rhodoblastus sphagnicola]PPQ30267.1 hypothetical protein CCR94_13170 [Rhodoblastus sphagnicola]
MTADIYARLRDLAASADSRPADMRPILLRVTTDLFVLHATHTSQEIRLYEEMACRLIDDADDVTLTLIAQRLAACADAPAAVLRRLRARGGAVARELLLSNRQIAWADLREIAATGPRDHACALAARADLDREIASILAGRPEREVARALAANAAAPLAMEDMRLLISRGREDKDLARTLLERGGLSVDHLPLYLSGDAEQRGKLLHIARAAGVAALGRPDATGELDPAACAKLENAALRQKHAAFALVLAEIIGCDPLCARRIVEEDSGDALTLALIAMGMPKEIAARIFLIAFPKVAMDRKAFERNIALYDTLPRRDAARVIGAVAGDGRLSAALARQQGRRGGATTARPVHAESESLELRDYLAARGAKGRSSDV